MNIVTLIAALIAVESGGNPRAVGDNGLAFGALQIHECVVKDVNQFKGTHYVHEDAFDPVKAQEICISYLERYATRARLGHEPTFQDMARIWNGGGNGYKKAATLGYWQKVKAKMR